jgi:hypothetical protein
MAVIAVTGTPVAGTKYTVTTASSADWASVSNSTYFFDLTDKLVHYKDSTGAIIELFGASGLSYFTEAQNTTAPNATVPVDSLTAVTGTTNGDFAILPKGTGAFIVGHIPDGTPTNGGKRGNYAVDIQPADLSYSGGASGVGAVAIGYRNRASGNYSLSIGSNSIASNTGAAAISGGLASGGASFAVGANGLSTATASGSGSVALGGGTASGDYSLATTFSQASGSVSVAMGGAYGGSGNAVASATYSFALGVSTRANGSYSMAILSNSDTYSHRNRLTYGTYTPTAGNPIGSIQGSTLVVGVDTTTATPTTLGTYGGTAIPLILQNNNSVRFKGTIIGRQSGSTNTSSWDIDGFIQRGTTAATTTLLISNVNVVQNTPAWGTPTLTADTSNGGLDIKVIGAATTSIRWTCVFTTTEVVYV